MIKTECEVTNELLAKITKDAAQFAAEQLIPVMANQKKLAQPIPAYVVMLAVLEGSVEVLGATVDIKVAQYANDPDDGEELVDRLIDQVVTTAIADLSHYLPVTLNGVSTSSAEHAAVVEAIKAVKRKVH